MPVRVESLDYRAPTSNAMRVGWLVLPVVGWAVLSTVVRVMRQRAQHPTLTPMSDEWLRTHEAASGRSHEY